MLQHSYTVAKLLRFGFLPARVRAVVWVMISILNSSCYTMISNEGEWSRPVVVPKTPELLADAKVALHCGVGSYEDDDWEGGRVAGCRHLGKILTNMGATIVARYGGARLSKREQEEEEEESDPEAGSDGQKLRPDFQLVYIDRSNTRDLCGWTVVPFLLSLTFFPCIEDIRSHAELRFLNTAGDIVDSYDFHLDSTVIYGPAALYFLGIETLERPESRIVRARRRQTYFLEFVKSRIISHWTRLQLERKSKPGASA